MEVPLGYWFAVVVSKMGGPLQLQFSVEAATSNAAECTRVYVRLHLRELEGRLFEMRKSTIRWWHPIRNRCPPTQ